MDYEKNRKMKPLRNLQRSLQQKRLETVETDGAAEA